MLSHCFNLQFPNNMMLNIFSCAYLWTSGLKNQNSLYTLHISYIYITRYLLSVVDIFATDILLKL